MDEYRFPESRLKRKMDNPEKTPLLLIACGSFSPITFLHLRMFVMAADYAKHNTDYEMVGGYLSPVSDAYKKQGLSSAEHRWVPSKRPRCHAKSLTLS
jgi:nicotinamide mononucleotide adenylyltransferase